MLAQWNGFRTGDWIHKEVDVQLVRSARLPAAGAQHDAHVSQP